MKKIYLAMLIALVGLAFSGCQQEKQQDSFYLSDLQGKWLEDGTQHYMVFTMDQVEEEEYAGYLWGKQWDEAEKVYENRLEYHGNGWFMYKLMEKGKVREIHVMDNQGGIQIKHYILSILTGSKMVRYEEDNKNAKEYFTKVNQ